MSDLITILSSGTLSALIAGALVFLFRNWISERIKSAIQHEYDQKLETHKAQLKAESEIAIEKLKSELQITANERSIKLTKVFEKQAEVIAESYAMVVELNDMVRTTVTKSYSKNPADKENIDFEILFFEKHQVFDKFFNKNKILFPRDTSVKIDWILSKLAHLHLLYSRFISRLNIDDNKSFYEDPVKELQVQFENEVPKLLTSLENDFQTILGIHTSNR